MCALGLDTMPGADYLEVSGNVYVDVSRLGLGFCEIHILMLGPTPPGNQDLGGRGLGMRTLKNFLRYIGHESLIQIQ